MAPEARPTAYFSFDIEEHHRIEAAVGLEFSENTKTAYAQRMVRCTKWILAALAEFQAKATFFVVGEIAESYPHLIRLIVKNGHELASHSHQHFRVHRFTPQEFKDDLLRSKHALEDAGGVEVVGFRAPTFSVVSQTAWAIDVLQECGFQYDSSIFPVKHDRYGVPDAPRHPFLVHGKSAKMLELPPVTLKVGNYNLPAAGGGYFRLFPPAIMRSAIRQSLKDPHGLPVLYFHPWEFDLDQPKLPLKTLSRFRTYVGISRSRSRLRQLLKEFHGARMIDAARTILENPAHQAQLPEYILGATPGASGTNDSTTATDVTAH